MKFKILMVLAFALGSAQVHADQCDWIDSTDQAYVFTSAEKILKTEKDYVSYCAPCNNGLPGAVKTAQTVTVAPVSSALPNSPPYMTVMIDGVESDLAYIYVRTGTRVFTNLAMLVGCPAVNVPPVLYTAPGKSPSPVSWEDLSTGARKPSSVPAKKAKK